MTHRRTSCGLVQAKRRFPLRLRMQVTGSDPPGTAGTERHDVAVWSQDKDLLVSKLEVVTTGDLLDLLEGQT